MTRIIDLPAHEYVLPGNRACAGCGIGIGLRAITKALDGRMVMAVPASCLTVLGGMYPTASVEVPWVNVAFPSTAAAAAGLAAGLRATGRDGEMTVLAMAGDGGTGDIGIQALSGAAERNDDFIYLCYDNEAYMNTGTQRSGLDARRRADHHHVVGQAREPQGPAAHHGSARDPVRRVDLGRVPRRRLRQGAQGARDHTACATST